LRCRFSRGFDLTQKIAVKRSSPWIVHYGSLREVWRHILQQVCPFPNQFRVYIGEAGNVAARMRETFYKPEADRIVHERTNDRNGAGHLLHDLDRRCAVGHDQVGRERDQLLAVFTDQLDLAARPTIFDLDVLAIFPAEIDQALPECRNTLLTIDIA